MKLYNFTLFLADGETIKVQKYDSGAPPAEIAKDFTINGYNETKPGTAAGRFIAAKSILAVGWKPAEEGK